MTVWVTAYLILCIVSLICAGTFNPTWDLTNHFEIVLNRKCADEKLLLQRLLSVSFEQCVEECDARPDCPGVIYQRMVKLCTILRKAMDIDTVFNDTGPCIVGKKSESLRNLQTNLFPDVCGCSDGEKCNKESHVCSVEECGSISINNGKILGNINRVGSRIKFMCDPEYSEASVITQAVCQENGNWSHYPLCRRDEISVGRVCQSNADCEADVEGCIKINQTLVNGTCFCLFLYEYSNVTRNCVKVCSDVSPDYTVQNNTRILGYNLVASIQASGLQECLDRCSNSSECLSVEVTKISNSTFSCNTNSLTADMIAHVQPENLFFDTTYSLYSKSCLRLP